MHCALAEAAASYPSEVARDLDLYLTIARSLLVDAAVPSVLGTDTFVQFESGGLTVDSEDWSATN